MGWSRGVRSLFRVKTDRREPESGDTESEARSQMSKSISRTPDAIGRYIRPGPHHSSGGRRVVIRSIGNYLHHDWGEHLSACCCCGHGQRHLTSLCLGKSWDPGSDSIGRCDRDLKLECSSGCGGGRGAARELVNQLDQVEAASVCADLWGGRVKELP